MNIEIISLECVHRMLELHIFCITLARTVRVSGRVEGIDQTSLDSLDDVYNQRAEGKGKKVSSDFNRHLFLC